MLDFWTRVNKRADAKRKYNKRVSNRNKLYQRLRRLGRR